ncbi:MAG: hypothetical protein WC955_06365 [Elusimicrobiota bacterium]
MEKLAYVILGWLLGIGGQFLLARNISIRNMKSFKTCLVSELENIASVLSWAYYLLNCKIRKFDSNSFRWWVIAIKEFDTNMSDDEKELISKVESNFEQCSKIHKLKYGNTNNNYLFVKKIRLPYLEQNLTSISLLDSSIQKNIMSLLRQINTINEEIELLNFYFKKGFDLNCTDTDEIIKGFTLDENQIAAYHNISRHIKDTIELIREIIRCTIKAK